jgi:hypothetical protein
VTVAFRIEPKGRSLDAVSVLETGPVVARAIA